MKIKDHLKTEQLKQLGKMGKKKKIRKQIPKEKKVNWIMDRDKYSCRHGNAVRMKLFLITYLTNSIC